MRTFWLLSPEEIAKNLKRCKWRKKFFYANSLEISENCCIFASEKRIMYNTNLIVMKQNFLLLGLIVLLFTACGKYSPSIDSIIDDYIRENGASEDGSDSTFYVTVCFWRTKDSLRVHITGCADTPIIPVRSFQTEQEGIEAIRNGEDMNCPLYGYYRREKNQWVLVFNTDSRDLPIIRDMFVNKPWRHDKEYEKWQLFGYETDLWFYKIEGSRLVLRRKDVW